MPHSVVSLGGPINVDDDNDDETTNKGPSQTWTSGAHPLRGGSNIATMKAAAKDHHNNNTNNNVNEETTTKEMAHHGRFFAVNSKASVRSTTTATTTTSDNNDVPPPSLATTTTTKKKRIRRIMDYESIALALRLTCEVNRRLDCAIVGGGCTPQSKPFGWTNPKSSLGAVHDPTTGRSVLDSRTYGDRYPHPSEQYQQSPSSSAASSTLVHVHPSQAWQRPIRDRAEAPFYDPQGPLTPRSTTLFNTPHRQRTQPLADHVEQIAATLEYGPIIPALALLLLDRASSVETQRGNDGGGGSMLVEKTCPYLTPRTVHKLYLTAVVLANRMVRGELPSYLHQPHTAMFQDEYTQYYAELLTRGGIEITPYELGEMMEWMFHSLGTDGLNVSQSEVDRLLTSWKGLFIWENEGEEERDGRHGDGAVSMGHSHDAAFVRGDSSWESQEVSRGPDNISSNQEMGGMEGAQNYSRQQQEHILRQG